MKSNPPVVTHLWGKPADMAGLTSLAKDRDLDLLARLDAYLAGREEIAAYLTRELGQTPGLEVAPCPRG
ncbi:hypothetical protein P8A18_13850 [Streptomyces castrisilvae]|uniref:Uncharacterized protein n=1 Tax=Streptomyces castrisilvae TaxID=3033811 RepID=A0ABY9HIT9_9ACTN|nr:hypothetical protein [Streptomyces sp. Mut1]WLQ34455.1 hypothetical protein P8A18_13850 [Streptomyces sp. Mut1]